MALHEQDTLRADDRRELAARGIDLAEAERQIALLREPPAAVRLLRPATLGDGIVQLRPSEHGALLDRFDAAAHAGRLSKFVPASGAATRMFRALLAVRGNVGTPADRAACERFLAELERFAFADALADACRDVAAPAAWLDALLDSGGLGYSDLPKGLLLFHRHPSGPRTSFAEHLAEAAAHLRDASGTCKLHFTVSREHEALFRRHLEEIGPRLEAALEARFEIEFSHQSPRTDTLALGEDGAPFRLDDGSLLLRPGGHGALLDNLGELARGGADLVFVKNIDNVVPDDRREVVVLWKKLLAGHLLRLEEKIVDLLERSADTDPATWNAAAATFFEEHFFADPPDTASSDAAPSDPAARRARLRARLDRPLRVCGMVRNAGEPGGGPFWTAGPDPGETSLQIVETSQIDRDDPDQAATLAAATHFNPVDLVCRLRDPGGKPYDLPRYVDRDAVFVSKKSQDGRPLRALEHPGLWNGAMARWNTVFVEVPAETFAPVKTVLDLLRPEHQAR